MNIEIRKSFRFIALLALIHLGALILLLTLPWPQMVLAAGMALILLHGLWTAWLLHGWPYQLTLRDDGTALVKTRQGHSEARIAAARRLPGTVQLLLKPAQGRSRALLLMQDAISAGDFHEISARIRQQRLPVRALVTPP